MMLSVLTKIKRQKHHEPDAKRQKAFKDIGHIADTEFVMTPNGTIESKKTVQADIEAGQENPATYDGSGRRG